MSKEIELTDLQIAWLEERSPKGFKRDKEADDIRHALQLPVVRKRTIHIAPQAVQLDVQARKAEEGRLMYQAGRLGKSWSKWINEARPGGWRNIDIRLTQDWSEFASNIGDFEEESRERLITQIAKGMGLEREIIRKDTPANINKISYVLNAVDGRLHTLVGINEVPINKNSFPAGGFFVASIVHLSQIEPGSSLLRELNDSILIKYQNIGELRLNDTCGVIGAWISDSTTRAYFQERVNQV